MQQVISRPIAEEAHPITTGQYRVATAAIQNFYDLVERLLRNRTLGALVHGAPRLGKTQGIEYVRMLLAREYPKVTTYHVHCEHKPRHAEGPFFSNLLAAVGDPNPAGGTNPAKRLRLATAVRHAASLAGSGIVLMFCDEAQRYDDNEYEWLRDVHDGLQRLGIRMISVLVGQPELLAKKTSYQQAGRMQIIARLMVEELAFRGMRNADEMATCLLGYDETRFPENSGWSYTRFFLPRAFDHGLRLLDSAAELWQEFVKAHLAARIGDELELPMEFFTRAVEIALRDCSVQDAPDFRITGPMWAGAVRQSGYVMAKQATSRVWMAA